VVEDPIVGGRRIPAAEGRDAHRGDLGELLAQRAPGGAPRRLQADRHGPRDGMHAVNLYTEVKNVYFSSE